MRTDNIKMLQETLQILDQGSYIVNGKTVRLKLAKETMESVHVLLPKKVQDICGRTDFGKARAGGKCSYGCMNMDSFAAARRHYESSPYLPDKDEKPVLVLNLANAVHPGGGVRRGTKAQEEDLCRKSSLLLSLESKHAVKYYEYNRKLHTYMGSDAMIFTPKVEIIRDENGHLLEDTVIVAVLTCAAPKVSFGKEGMSETSYREMVYNRIMGMLKCAAYFGYENLILGAWGCGAFGNDAHVISDLFYKALEELDFNGFHKNGLFHRIDFAVLDHTPQQYNFKEFYRNFSPDSHHKDGKREKKAIEQETRHGTGNQEEDTSETSNHKKENREAGNNRKTAGKTEFMAVKGDITKNHGVQAIVNAANTSLLGGGGVDGAIHRAAGPKLLEECRLLNGCRTGKAKITKAYQLPCEYVIHTPGPRWNGGKSKEHELLASCYRSCLELAAGNGIRSIAFPSISTGIYHFPIDEAAKIAIRTAKDFVSEYPGELDVIRWVLFDDYTLDAYQKELGLAKDSYSVALIIE